MPIKDVQVNVPFVSQDKHITQDKPATQDIQLINIQIEPTKEKDYNKDRFSNSKPKTATKQSLSSLHTTKGLILKGKKESMKNMFIHRGSPNQEQVRNILQIRQKFNQLHLDTGALKITQNKEHKEMRASQLSINRWVSNQTNTLRETMGMFNSPGRDPLNPDLV